MHYTAPQMQKYIDCMLLDSRVSENYYFSNHNPPSTHICVVSWLDDTFTSENGSAPLLTYFLLKLGEDLLL